MMKTYTDAVLLHQLLSRVHDAAFQEPLAHLPYSKARLLSYLIQEKTGFLLSYKTLSNYVAFALQPAATAPNPALHTLGVLAQFACNWPPHVEPGLYWFRFKQQMVSC
jgi:hypothetical protein